MINYNEIFIRDIYENGLTPEVIERHKSNFPEITLLIHKDAKFIQANEIVLEFETGRFKEYPELDNRGASKILHYLAVPRGRVIIKNGELQIPMDAAFYEDTLWQKRILEAFNITAHCNPLFTTNPHYNYRKYSKEV